MDLKLHDGRKVSVQHRHLHALRGIVSFMKCLGRLTREHREPHAQFGFKQEGRLQLNLRFNSKYNFEFATDASTGCLLRTAQFLG